MTATSHAQPGTMRDARLLETKVLLPKPKRFVCETLQMPDGHEFDWYYVDTPASVMVVPVTSRGTMVLVRQYRHNLKRYTLEFPAGAVNDGEEPDVAARRELEEETGYILAPGASMRPLGAYYSLPSETNKYTHVFLAEPVTGTGPAALDTLIEKYFDMSVTEIPVSEVMGAIGKSITGTETITALMLAHAQLRSGVPGS